MTEQPFLFDENTPGSLGKPYEGFAPNMPEGSWERLAARRKNRRLAFWWWLPALFLAVGSLIWWSIEPETVLFKSEDIAFQPNRATVSPDTKNEKTILPSPKESLADKQPEVISSIQRSENTSENNRQQVVNEASFPAPGSEKLTSQSALQTSEAVMKTVALASGKRKDKEKRLKKKEIRERHFQPEHSASNPLIAEATDEKERKTKSNERQATSAFQQIEPVIINKAGWGEPDKPEPAQSTAKSNSESSVLTDAKSDDPQVIDKRKNVVEPIQQKIPDELDSTEIKRDLKAKETIVQALDSLNKQIAADQQLGFELLFGTSIVGQSVDLNPILFNEEVRILEPLQSKPLWGAQVGVRLRIPLGKSWTIFPAFDLGLLQQAVQYKQSAGGLSGTKLVRTDNGIIGVPEIAERVFWENRTLVLPAAGVEVGYRVSTQLQWRAGVQMAWVAGQSNETQSPTITNPMLLTGMHYQINRRWNLRLDMRYFGAQQMTKGPLSTSRNLMMCFGMAYKIK